MGVIDMDDLPELPVDIIGAAKKLSDLLDLPEHRKVAGARIVGSGLTASVEIDLTDGQTMEFAALREVGSADLLALTVASYTGATPKITKHIAIQAVALLRDVAERTQAISLRDMAANWGREFLWAAAEHPVDVNDQASRWEALVQLTELDPVEDARRDGGSIAASSVVLVDVTGVRYVRTSWFRAHVRSQEPGVSPQQIAQRILLAGWQRHGKTGKLHAREPDGSGQLLVPFYVVPKGWEDVDA